MAVPRPSPRWDAHSPGRQLLSARELINRRRPSSSPLNPKRLAPALRQAWRPLAWRWGPPLVAALLLLLGYIHYAPGTAYSLSAEHYRAWSFPAFRYSDLIWLYLRDGLADHRIPYLDYPLEYPPLTGLLSYALSWAPDLPTNFALTYLLLTVAGLGTIVTLRMIPGANPWVYAAAPALFFYTGHQWDPAAIFVTSVALLLHSRGRDRWGAVALAAAVSLKLFPLAFVAAVLIDRLRQRRLRAVVEIGVIFAAVTAVINLPVALANFDGWAFFVRWNRDRLADSGIWVLWRGVPTETLTVWSSVAAVAGGPVIAALTLAPRGIWRRPAAGSVLLPLGASFLLWWLFVNKTFTTHLILWVFLALALVRPAWWLWLAVVAVDLVGFQIGNYLNLYNIPEFRHAPLIRAAVENIYDPLQLARSAVLLAAVGWGARELRRRVLRQGVRPVPIGSNGTGRVASLGEAKAAWSRRSRDIFPVPIRPTIWPRLADRDLAARWRHLAAPALAVLGFGVATIALTWPYAANLRDSTLVGFDPLLQIWLSQWIQHALSTQPLALYDSNIFYPFPLTLAYTDANIPGALLAWPLDLATRDPFLTNSLLTLATFPLAAAGMSAVIVRLTGNRAAGFLAGLAYAFLPFRLVHLWHLNWLESAWLPWLFLALLRLMERPTRGRALLLGGLIAVQTLTSFYFALQIGLLLAATSGALLLAERRSWGRAGIGRRLAAIALAGGFAALIAVPFLVPYLGVRAEQGLERTLEDAETYKATAGSYLTLAPWDKPGPLGRLLGARPGRNESLTEVGQARHADGHRHPEIVIEDALFPGTLTLVGALAALAVAIWRPRQWPSLGRNGRIDRHRHEPDPTFNSAWWSDGLRHGAIDSLTNQDRPATPVVLGLAVTAALAALLSFGPTWGEESGNGVPLPYGWLFEHAPFFTSMRVPARLGGLVGFALVAMAGVAAAWSWRWLRARPRLGNGRRRLAALASIALGVLLLLSDLVAIPIPLERVDRSAEIAAPYEWLATQPAGPVMEFPAESIFADPAAASVRRHVGLSMYWSTRHWQPLVNGSSGFIPRGYSDLIEAFMGEIPRPDGGATGRISHVNARSAALLRQLGVRYLLIHRSQYRPEDWPAVRAALATAEWAIEPIGEIGEAAVYRVKPAIADDGPVVTLYAPTLLGLDDPWAPTLTISKPGDSPAYFALTRPSTMTTTWYDAAGRLLWRGERPLPLPTMLGAELTRCTVSGCQGVAPTLGGEYPQALSPPKPSGDWQPTKAGHYVVRLEIDGDRSLRCRIDLDLVEDDAAIKEIAPDDPWRWAVCDEDGTVPTNNPGAPSFRASSPSVTFVGGTAAVEATLMTRRDGEVQAWFLLAPPGSFAPWSEAAYRSPTRQRVVREGETAAFDWLETLTTEVPPGVYGLTIWFHHKTETGWEHADGGGYQMSPVVIDADGFVRWAGPVRLSPSEPLPPRLVVGRRTVVPLDVTGTSRSTACRASWRLLDLAGEEAATGGAGGGGCERPEIAIPERVAPGSYRLEILANAVRGGRVDLSDGVSLPVTLIEGGEPGTAR